jgi:hypothetical protein
MISICQIQMKMLLFVFYKKKLEVNKVYTMFIK